VGKTAGFDEKLCVHRIPPMNFAVSCSAGMGGKNEMGWAMKSGWSETNKPPGRKSMPLSLLKVRRRVILNHE
jgi:hypothetical protein